jgi:hypothetical protein
MCCATPVRPGFPLSEMGSATGVAERGRGVLETP